MKMVLISESTERGSCDFGFDDRVISLILYEMCICVNIIPLLFWASFHGQILMLEKYL